MSLSSAVYLQQIRSWLEGYSNGRRNFGPQLPSLRCRIQRMDLRRIKAAGFEKLLARSPAPVKMTACA